MCLLTGSSVSFKNVFINLIYVKWFLKETATFEDGSFLWLKIIIYNKYLGMHM